MATNRMIPNYELSSHIPIRFENALKESLPSKCKLLSDLIIESLSLNTKEIQQRFVILIEDIFSFHNANSPFPRSNWKLKLLTKQCSQEFNLIYQFLNSNGILFKLIRHLMNDVSNRYDFPIMCLPPSSRLTFEDSVISNFYSNKVSTNSSSYISLNAFEFYMFHFAYYITKNEVNSGYFGLNGDVNSNENANALYYILLENYLEVFVPIPNSKQNENKDNENYINESHSLWKSLSSTTTNLLNLTTNKNDYSFQNNNCNISKNSNFFDANLANKSSQDYMLFPKSPVINSKILSLGKFQEQLEQNLDQITNDIIGTVFYKCETIINILSELWLNHATNFGMDEDQFVKNICNNFRFTVEHMRAIRIFVKHLHYFVNSYRKKNYEINSSLHTQYNSGGIVSSSINDPLDDLKRNLWTSKYQIQKRLYQFLRLAFDRWPNDSSFRVLLETWLSYIQPWRYVSKKMLNQSINHQNENQLDGCILSSDHSEWKRFISENLFFYTIIFRQVITRISKILDLNSISNSLLVYRLTKVFAQDQLRDWIKESELNLLSGSDLSLVYNRMNSNHNLLSPSIKQHISNNTSGAPFKNALLEMEPFLSEYVSIFSPSFREQIINLVLKISKFFYESDLNNQTSEQNQINSTSHGLLASFINFFTIESANSSVINKTNESIKIKHHLESSIHNLSLIFNIQQQSIETIMNNEKNAIKVNDNLSNMNSTFREQNVYENIDGIPKLSEHGRNLIMNGNFKPTNLPNIIEGNPDTQPIRTFEIGLLVKIAIFLSLQINKRYEQFFRKHYGQKHIFSFFIQQFLSPPVKFVRYVKSENGLNTEMVTECLPPRVNLRFIASVDFVFYTFICTLFMMFFNFFNYSIISFFILALITLLSYLFILAVWKYVKIE